MQTPLAAIDRPLGLRLRADLLAQPVDWSGAPTWIINDPLTTEYFQFSAEEYALISRLYEVLESLPVDERIAWSLRYLEGEPLDAIAAACGCSLSTAKRRVGAAKEVIDEVFRDE